VYVSVCVCVCVCVRVCVCEGEREREGVHACMGLSWMDGGRIASSAQGGVWHCPRHPSRFFCSAEAGQVVLMDYRTCLRCACPSTRGASLVLAQPLLWLSRAWATSLCLG